MYYTSNIKIVVFYLFVSFCLAWLAFVFSAPPSHLDMVISGSKNTRDSDDEVEASKQ